MLLTNVTLDAVVLVLLNHYTDSASKKKLNAKDLLTIICVRYVTTKKITVGM